MMDLTALPRLTPTPPAGAGGEQVSAKIRGLVSALQLVKPSGSDSVRISGFVREGKMTVDDGWNFDLEL